jgi:hypothetical protein
VDDGGAGAVPWVGCDAPVGGDETVGEGVVGSVDWPAAVVEADPVVGPAWRFGVSVGDAAVELSKGLSSCAGGEFSVPGAGTSPAVVDPLLGLCSPAGGEF